MSRKKSPTIIVQKKVDPASDTSIIPTSTYRDEPQITLSASQEANLKFEYEYLREEISHNDTLTLQIVGAILVLSGALLPIAFNKDISIPHRWLLFLGMEAIAFLGLCQNTDRLRGTLIAASYNKVFIEAKVEYIKWETRLQAFRENKNRGGDLIMHQVWIYAILIFGNFCFAWYFFLEEYNSSPFSTFFSQIVITANQLILAGFVISALLFGWQLYICLVMNTKNTTFYDKAWLDVRDGKFLRK